MQKITGIMAGGLRQQVPNLDLLIQLTCGTVIDQDHARLEVLEDE
jgi:hypothetical protein